MSKLIRLLKSSREKGSLRDEKVQMKCTKCGKRPSTGSDGMCDTCRFDDVLTQLTETK